MKVLTKPIRGLLIALTMLAAGVVVAQVNVDDVIPEPPAPVTVQPLNQAPGENLRRLGDLADGTAELPGGEAVEIPAVADNPEPLLRDVSCDRYNHLPTREACLRAAIAYFNYRADGLEHRRGVFIWQLESSRVIFYVVIGLVLLGVVFAAIQFRAGMKAAYATSPIDGAPDAEDAAAQSQSGMMTEFVASMSEIRIRSPIIGVVILVISLAFLYLYLIYVYPINEIF